MSDERLLEVLEIARSLGYLGPGAVEPHLDHARGFRKAIEEAGLPSPASFVDLGTGGGVPGLVLASDWPHAQAVLVETMRRRAASLRQAVEALQLVDRVEVLEARAEAVAQEPAHRERFDLVTARSFAEPAVTAEIAAGLAKVGGVLLVSEPPEPDPARWPSDALKPLGFAPADRTTVSSGSFAILRKFTPAPPDRPRRTGIPNKRPLW